MNLEDLAKKFAALATQPKLSKSQQEEARDLMRQLKEAGMSNEQISKLSDGKWSPSTVKFYTPGIKPAHPTPWDDVVNLLKDFINVGFTLNDVKTALQVSEMLKSKGVSLNSMISLLFAIDSSSLGVADLIQQYESLKGSGLPPDKISAALDLIEELAKMGLNIGSMAPITELAKNYGDPDTVIEALSHYKSVVDLDEKITEAEAQIKGLDEQLNGTAEQIELAKTELSELGDLIAHYNEIEKLGFGINELDKIASLTQKHGSITKMMEAVDAFGTYSEILDKLNKAKSDLSKLKLNSEKVQADTAHLKSAVTMCQTMIDQYAFGLDAIATIFSLAGKYGAPIDVLKAIEAYGALESLNQEVAGRKGETSQLKKDIANLEGQRKQAQESLDNLNSLALKVGKRVGEIDALDKSYDQLRKLLEICGNPDSANYDEYIGTASILTMSLNKWVGKHEKQFKNFNLIRSGLEHMFKELGGIK